MKNIVAVSCLLLCVVASRSVEASTFTLSSLSVDLRNNDPGLVLSYWGSYTGDIELNGAGATTTKELFKIGTREGALNLDDLWPYRDQRWYWIQPAVLVQRFNLRDHGCGLARQIVRVRPLG